MKSPKSGKRYKEILDLGCDPIKEHGEFYCGHLYEWTCDECPIVREQIKYWKTLTKPIKCVTVLV